MLIIIKSINISIKIQLLKRKIYFWMIFAFKIQYLFIEIKIYKDCIIFFLIKITEKKEEKNCPFYTCIRCDD